MNTTAILPNPNSVFTTTTPSFQIPLSKWWLHYLSFIATGLVVMGILCNINFYSEFGQGSSSLVYAIIGLFLDLAKIAVIRLFVIFLADFERNATEITTCAVAWFVLSLLSFGAAYGFLSQINEQYEITRLKASNIYTQHEEAVKTAQQKLDELAQYASVNPLLLETRRAQLQTSLTQWETKKSRCPKNWFVNCLDPAQEQIDKIQAQLLPIAKQLEGHTAYQSAIQHKQMAIEAFSKLDASSAMPFHPLFVNVGNLTNTQTSSVKGTFILLTGFVVELLASILFFLKARLLSLPYVFIQNTRTSTKPYTQTCIVNTDAGLSPIQAPSTGVSTSPPVATLDLQTNSTNQTNQINLATPANTNAVNNTVNTTVYQEIVADIHSGNLTSASFRMLKAKYGLTQNDSTKVRNQLVVDGLAKLNKGELVFVV